MSSIVIPPTSSSEPSMADLRAMISASTAPSSTTAEEAKPEPVAPATTQPETVSETVEQKQDPKDSDDEPKDEPLPEGVAKRIAKEVAKEAQIQRKIDEAVSRRKAKEQELAAATTANPGSEPAKPNTAAVANDGKPVKPEFGTPGQTWGQYQDALAKYEADHEAWLEQKTRQTVEQEFQSRQKAEKDASEWQAAVKAQGADFPKLVETAIKTLHEELGPQGSSYLQKAIRDLDNWDAVAAHLGRKPDTLKSLIEKFQERPNAAIAMLGRIESSLKTDSKAAAPLPKPPAVEGGKSSASVAGFDWENASMSQIRAQASKIKKSSR